LAELFLQSCLRALLPLVAASALLEGVEEGLLVFLEFVRRVLLRSVPWYVYCKGHYK
jgi:hypothetical protein